MKWVVAIEMTLIVEAETEDEAETEANRLLCEMAKENEVAVIVWPGDIEDDVGTASMATMPEELHANS